MIQMIEMEVASLPNPGKKGRSDLFDLSSKYIKLSFNSASKPMPIFGKFG